MLNNQGHAFSVGVEWELFQNLVLFDLLRVLIHDFHSLLGALLKNETALQGALDECKLIWARCLVGRLFSLRINVHDNRVADSE